MGRNYNKKNLSLLFIAVNGKTYARVKGGRMEAHCFSSQSKEPSKSDLSLVEVALTHAIVLWLLKL